MPKGAMPVLIGAGQTVDMWDGRGDAAPSPLSLAARAALAALSDAGIAGLAGQLDCVAFVRTFEESVPRYPFPHGRNSNLPRTLCRAIGAVPRLAILSGVGGQTPQAMVNEMAARIHDGEIEAVLIAGAEATRASKAAQRAGVTLDWSDGDDAPFEDRGMGDRLLSRTEVKHGLVAPPYLYALIETAIAAREGRTRSGHRRAMAELFARFSEVAAGNPFSQFPAARTADFLATPSKDNYELADPFTKWHVAQDAVNQAAAVVLVSEALADEMGVAQARRVHLHGGAEAGDGFLSERPVIDRSWAMKAALDGALEAAGQSEPQIGLFDLYSCFPCAVTCAAEALGIDPTAERRALTVTGGLPFFGGPGNNYSLHGIATMMGRLRAAPDTFGLVLANGGWMTKEAAGIYSTARPREFRPVGPLSEPGQARVEVRGEAGPGRLETYTVVHGKSGPEAGIGFVRRPDGSRTIARADAATLMRLREDSLLAGAPVGVTVEDEVNSFSLA